ncbi:MAG: hypothetical protein PQJ35_00730 [Sphaerochaetaceae bacterium]|nr:hypothetical protein [Sphaerochaetaceae bacterium]
MSNDLKDAAMNAVKKKSVNVEKSAHSKDVKSKLYKDYFSLDTGEPIALEMISNRIRRRFRDIDRASTGAMLDLFFVYQNWTGFYSREDSFSKYLKELEVSRTHAYGIINSVELLNQYFIHKGNQSSDLSDFMNEITSSIEEIGIKKLIILSARKDESKYEVIDRLLEGEKITAETLLQKPEKKEKTKTKQSTVKMEGNDLKVGKTLVLTFNSENETIRKAVFRTVEKWYLKDLEPKKVKK